MDKFKTLLFVYFLTVVAIILYLVIVCKLLKVELLTMFQLPLGLDAWSISHFIYYAFLGYFFPEYFWFIMAVGVVWELLEYTLDKNIDTTKPSIFTDIYKCAKQTSDNFTISKFSDLIFNFLGFVFGAWLRSKKIF